MPRINTEYRGDAKRKILTAALMVGETKGIETVTLEEISQRVGVTKSALYAYFENRDALIRELVVEIFSRFQSDVGDAFADDPDMPVMLERLGTVLFTGQIKYASLFAQITKLNISSDPLLREMISDITQGSDIIVEQISHMQDQGRITNKGDPDEIVAAIIAFAIGIKVLASFKGWDVDRVRQMWENSVQLIVSHPSECV
ncbi:MAG: TetR/AcrR family transcriptional regulator [Methanoregula sp.]|jgi:AcrR family transcriptional regulator|uniref:TetR/AcrR family transcriptional regulator n=1 Tax=Methanoregula sp. TaxID=2052170 RepID=UPI003BAF473E